MSKKTIAIVAGARPNFVKIAPLVKAMNATDALAPFVIHTGQHYDFEMSKVFFEELDIPEPAVNLGVGSKARKEQIAEVMRKIEPVLVEAKPAALVVVGDVNSTVAAALVGAKLGIPVAHVEAGLRSFNWKMPEEINRVMTDHMSNLLFASEPSGVENLIGEGIAQDRIFHVGNVMIDTLRQHEPSSAGSDEPYGLVTIHRPENVDDPVALHRIMDVIESVSRRLHLVFPVHPRTQAAIQKSGGLHETTSGVKVTWLAPMGYVNFLKKLKNAKLVLTDSGGIQEETTALGVPCLTLRNETERPVTETLGTNKVVGTDKAAVLKEVEQILIGKWKKPQPIPLWDGHAAERIVKILCDFFS